MAETGIFPSSAVRDAEELEPVRGLAPLPAYALSSSPADETP
jgi:hypothetical protein